jgi:hypothetical protein
VKRTKKIMKGTDELDLRGFEDCMKLEEILGVLEGRHLDLTKMDRQSLRHMIFALDIEQLPEMFKIWREELSGMTLEEIASIIEEDALWVKVRNEDELYRVIKSKFCTSPLPEVIVEKLYIDLLYFEDFIDVIGG